MDYRYSSFEEGDHDTSPGLIRLYDMKNEALLQEAFDRLKIGLEKISDGAKDVTGFDHFNAEYNSFSVRVYTYRNYLSQRAVCELFEAVENLQKENNIW